MHEKPRVYLAGPVENVVYRENWRENFKKKTDRFDFIDPTDEVTPDSDGRIGEDEIDDLLAYVRLSDAIVMLYRKHVQTWGTPMEQYNAYSNGLPVITITNWSNNPSFLERFSTETVRTDREAIDWLEDYFQ